MSNSSDYGLREAVAGLADQWERLARNGPPTYAEIRRRHAADLRRILAETNVYIRRAKAEAWDEGFEACFNVTGESVKQDVPNPYHPIASAEGDSA